MEPERPIEKVLRAYAKKRRDEAGAAPELHPAIRRLLQDEIARRRPKPAGSGDSFFAGLFASAGRKLAFAACVMAFILIGGMLIIPSLSTAKYRAQGSMAMSNLKQIGTAIFLFSGESNRMPVSLDEIKGQLVSEKTLIDPQSGQRFVYVGGENRSEADPQAMLAYSPVDQPGRFVLFTDGHVDKVSSSQFAELSNRTVALIASSSSLNRNRPADMIAASPPPTSQPVSADDKERSDAGKSVAATAGAVRLEDRQRVLAATEKSQVRESVTPTAGGEVAPGNAAPPPAVLTLNGATTLSGATDQTRRDAAVAYDSMTNSQSFAAKGGTDGLTVWNGQPAAEIPKFENSTNFVATAGALVPAPANVEELKAGTKLDFKQAEANNNNEAGAYAISQQYVQTVAPADAQFQAKRISSPVLVSFQVQQSDQNLRVVDQDGSVYNGYWRAADMPAQVRKALPPQPSTTPAAGTTGLPEADARAYKDQQPTPQNYFFQVTGTNRSLNQNVVFNGNFMALTSGVPLVQMNGLFNNSFGGGGAGGGLQNKMSNQSLQLLLSNSRISGTAVIDNNRQVQINAVPTAAPR